MDDCPGRERTFLRSHRRALRNHLANASLAATDRGGYLATITSAAENAFVFNLADQDPIVWYNGYGPWLGGIQPVGSAEPAGGWSWITGEPFTYQNWAPLQPNNNQNEDRIHFGGQANRSSMWNDVGRNTVTFTRGFAVEYDLHRHHPVHRAKRFRPSAVELALSSRCHLHHPMDRPTRRSMEPPHQHPRQRLNPHRGRSPRRQ